METLKKQIVEVLTGAGAGDCALLDEASLRTCLDERAQTRMDAAVPGWRGIICIVVPYYAGDVPTEDDRPPLARYARGLDYHDVLGEMLEAGVKPLREAGYRAASWVDASPVPEVRAAAMCGLGVIGQNGLLLTPRYGSWAFIGCIATDAPLAFEPAREIGTCIGCGACVRACPGSAIRDGKVDALSCLSAISQRGGNLTPQEADLLRKNRVIWGCDRCQEVCPANCGAAETQIPAFRENLLDTIPVSVGELTSRRELGEKWPGRAFTWKGLRVLQRNLGLFEQDTAEKTV